MLDTSTKRLQRKQQPDQRWRTVGMVRRDRRGRGRRRARPGSTPGHEGNASVYFDRE